MLSFIHSPANCGKTMLVGSFISDTMTDTTKTFDKIVVVTTTPQQPSWVVAAEKFNVEVLMPDKLPDIDNDDGATKLIVFDDCFGTNMNEIRTFFIRGRHTGWSCIFITQSWHKTDTIIRRNSNVLALFKPYNEEDSKAIMNECSGGVTQEVLMSLLKEATSEEFTPLVIHLDELDNNHRFYKGFRTLMNIDRETFTTPAKQQKPVAAKRTSSSKKSNKTADEDTQMELQEGMRDMVQVGAQIAPAPATSSVAYVDAASEVEEYKTTIMDLRIELDKMALKNKELKFQNEKLEQQLKVMEGRATYAEARMGHWGTPTGAKNKKTVDIAEEEEFPIMDSVCVNCQDHCHSLKKLCSFCETELQTEKLECKECQKQTTNFNNGLCDTCFYCPH